MVDNVKSRKYHDPYYNANSKMVKIYFILFLIKQYWSLELKSCTNVPPDQVCKLVDEYDKNFVPGKLPIHLDLSLDIQEVVKVDTFKGTMTVLLYSSIYWTDPNLSFKPEKMLVYLHTLIYIHTVFCNFLSITSHDRKNISYIPFKEDIAALIWQPTLTFLNIKEMKPMRGIGYKEYHEYNFLLPPPIRIQFTELLEVTVHCQYELTTFPFDHQECDLSLWDESNGVEYVMLNETEAGYKGQLNVINLPQQYGIPYKIEMKSVGAGNITWYDFKFSTSTLRFSMQRNSIDLLLGSFYIPTGLFGFLSMASYIMNPDTVSTYY